MNIVVCVKQVPASSDVKIDPVTGTLIRDGNNTKMNPYDLYGIETAVRLKEKYGAVIKCVSMGPGPAKAVLEESLWMGCDEGLLISDRKFGGADVVATSYTIGQGILTLGDFDLIICGRQTTDGDTAQVGPEMAESLGIPHVAYVDEVLEVNEEKKTITVKTTMDSTIEILEVKLPCLITVDKGSLTPRLPSYKRGKEVKNVEIKVTTFADVKDQNEYHYGLKGSPTQVERMFPPERNTDRLYIKGSAEEQALELAKILKDRKFI